MNLRQRLSLFLASVLPVLALCAYFLIAPARAVATSCPGGGMQDGGCPNGGCHNAGGSCSANGSTNGVYIFCRSDYGNGYPPGRGPAATVA